MRGVSSVALSDAMPSDFRYRTGDDSRALHGLCIGSELWVGILDGLPSERGRREKVLARFLQNQKAI